MTVIYKTTKSGRNLSVNPKHKLKDLEKADYMKFSFKNAMQINEFKLVELSKDVIKNT